MRIHLLPQIAFCTFISLLTPLRVFSIPEFDSSEVEIEVEVEVEVPEDFVFDPSAYEEDNNNYRRLQVEGPYHNGTRFSNMFLNGDRWQNDVDIAQSAHPTKIGWKNGYMYFGDESQTQASEEAKQTFTVANGTFNGYSSGLRVWHEMGVEASHARANFMKPLCISTCYLATVNDYGNGTLQMQNRHLGNFTENRDQQFKVTAAARFAEVFPRYIMRANQVQRLLDGLTGTIDESYISFRSMNARLVTRNQIRVVFDGLGYMHRVYENKYSGFTNALSFAEMHNTVNGANNPPFSKCRKSYLSYTSPDPTIPEDAETAFCCNGQCTTDISTKAWQSYGCELTVDDCYNAMLDTCAPITIRCMQLIADPEDQWPSYREPLPHKNLWVWSAHLDMVGGGEYSNEWQRWVRNNSEDPIEFAKIEGHHTIPFTNIGFGNGNYEITFMLKQGDLINQASLPLVKLVVYSYSVNAVLYEQMVNCGDIPTGQVWTPITFELVMADRHLADLAFRIEMQPNTNTQVGYDYVKVKYLFYDTLSPTLSPTMAPTVPKRHYKMLAHDGAANDRYGYAVATNGDMVVVGAEQDDDGSSNSGSIYVYNAFGSFIRKITSPDAALYAQFGYSVAMSNTHIVVGAFDHDQQGTDAGAAYLFTTSGSFVRLMLCLNGAANDRCGTSVAIDGNNILLGAPLNDADGNDAGAAYHYTTSGYVRRISANGGGSGDRFGISVAVSGNTFIIGAHHDDLSGDQSGSVYFYNTGGTFLKKISAFDAKAGSMFGMSVAASSSLVVVGAPNHAIESSVEVGKVYVYTIAGDLVTHFNAPDWSERDNFGFSVDVSDDRIVVGAQNDDDVGVNSGSVYVFSLSGDLIEKLTPERNSDGIAFGIDVAVAGSVLVVGASLSDSRGTDSGVVYLYSDATHEPSMSPTSSPSMSPTETPPCDVPVRVDILTDQYPQETSWTITDSSNNNVVLSSTSYTTESAWHYTSGCLRYARAYSFTINDSASDGICCQYGSGGYYVMLNDGPNYTISNPNNEFGATASYNFFSGLGSLQNRALDGNAYQTCTSSGGDPSRAIDGNTDGIYENLSVSHTCAMQRAAWRVDLPSRTEIRLIEIFNRADDCCRERLSDSDVQILDADFTVLDSRYIGDMSASASISFEFPEGTFGYKVRLKLRGNNVLSLAEVKVWGTEALMYPGTENRALSGNAVQSCTSNGGDPSRAIDGNTGAFNPDIVSHTCSMQGAAWRVDLPSRTEIKAIEIFNRAEFKERLSDSDVQILGADHTVLDSRYIGDMSASRFISFEFPEGTFGYKVRVKLRGTNILSLAEVKVWGTESLPCYGLGEGVGARIAGNFFSNLGYDMDTVLSISQTTDARITLTRTDSTSDTWRVQTKTTSRQWFGWQDANLRSKRVFVRFDVKFRTKPTTGHYGMKFMGTLVNGWVTEAPLGEWYHVELEHVLSSTGGDADHVILIFDNVSVDFDMRDFQMCVDEPLTEP